MINLKVLRNELKNTYGLPDKNIIIKRKKKMMLVKAPNGYAKLKRKNIIKVEIIE